MVWIRYLAYFIGIAIVTWAIRQFELASPGGLKLHVVVSDGDVFGTSEFSPVEARQAEGNVELEWTETEKVFDPEDVYGDAPNPTIL